MENNKEFKICCRFSLKNSSQNPIGQKKFKIAQKQTACIANSNCRNHDPRG